MRTVRLKSGGSVHIIPDPYAIPNDGAIYFKESEYAFAHKLSSSLGYDPEQQRAFWQTLLEKKELDRYYSLFTDFPREDDPTTPKGAMAKKYCGPILDLLRGRPVHPDDHATFPAQNDEPPGELPLVPDPQGTHYGQERRADAGENEAHYPPQESAGDRREA
jgi:hypothetical protein